MDPRPLEVVTLVLPYYRQPLMLKRQMDEWERFPAGYDFIVVDDGSPEPALEVLAHASEALRKRLKLFRITVDIPWNRGGARNLGTSQSHKDWIIHADTDHVLPVGAAEALLEHEPKALRWYRFRRWRQGRADFTRKKDQIPPGVTFGEIHPHIDSYLIQRKTYDGLGGYDEDYSGMLGGGSAFLNRLEAGFGPPKILPLPICLHVYTTDRIADASITTLDRDTQQGKDLRRRKEANKRTIPINSIRFPWVRIL